MATYRIVVYEEVELLINSENPSFSRKVIYEQTITEELEADVPIKFDLEGIIKKVNNIY